MFPVFTGHPRKQSKIQLFEGGAFRHFFCLNIWESRFVFIREPTDVPELGRWLRPQNYFGLLRLYRLFFIVLINTHHGLNVFPGNFPE